MFQEKTLQQYAVNQHINSVHNTRKYHKRINKTDKTEPLGVEYVTALPTNPYDVYHFLTKVQLFDFIEKCLRENPDLQWSDFKMIKITTQKLIS